ncbi:MAG: tetratricopeptide repeat protein [Spirochaetales bacterium]|nr:tetratricopeptide repeat protein [Spirochaetales bacterium]
MTYKELTTRAFNAFRVKDLDLAESLAEKLLVQYPKSPDLHLFLGNIKTRQDQFDAAVSHYRDAIQLKPDNAEAFNNLSVAFKMKGELKAAVAAAEKAYALNPRRADIAYNLGNIYKQAGRVKEAVDYYKLALQGDPGFIPVYNNLGNLYEKTGKHNLAEELYRQGLEQDENNPMLRYNLGVALDNTGEYEKSLEEYRRAQKSRPGWTDNLNNLAVTLQRLGKPEEAQRLFQRALEMDPKNPKLNNNLGVLYTELGRYDEAENYYKRALSSDAGYSKPLINLGHLDEKTGQYEKAIEHFTALAEADPRNTRLQLDLAEALIHEKRLKEAGGIIIRTEKMEPDNPLVPLTKGNWYVAAGKKKKALHQYLKALSLDESNTDARMRLALLYKELKKYEKAIAEVSHILLKKPDSFAPRLLLGELYLEQNLYREALEIFETLDREYPGNEDVLTALTHNYKAMGNTEKALQIAEKLATMQGKKGGPEDLDRMDSTLEWYEQVAGEYAEEYEEIWKRNIQSLTEEAEDQLEKGAQQEEDSFLLGKLFDINGETVPIIDTGGIEPYIEINEPTETLILQEKDEELPEIEEEKPEKEILETLRESVPPAPPSAPSGAPGAPFTPGTQGSGGGETGKKAGFGEEHIHIHTAAPPPAALSGGSFQASLKIESPIVIRQEGESAAPQLAPEQPSGPEPEPARTSPAPPKPQPPGPPPVFQPSMPPRAPGPFSPGETPPLKKEETPAELLDYLMGLTRSLPQEERNCFDHSEMRLKIESIRERLRGRPGIYQRLPEKSKTTETSVTKGKIHDTFSFMESLTDYHPDTSVGETMKLRIRHLLSKLGGPADES